MDNIIIKLSFIKKAIKKGNRKKAANAEIADTRNIKKTNNQIESKKRPVSAVADNFEVRNIKKVIVRIQKKVKFNLLYDKKSSLHKMMRNKQLLYL